MPDGRRANRNPALIKMAQIRCQELELVYGRGDYETKRARPIIPDGVLNVESDLINVTEGRQTDVLKYLVKKMKDIQLTTDEECEISKKIILELTEAIMRQKEAAQEKSIDNLLREGRAAADQPRTSYSHS